MMLNDSGIRKLALDPRQSFIVQAPAGAGKTELLTQRYLKLLTIVDAAPEEIVAVTFTRKAASEMRQRVIDALKMALGAPPMDDHKIVTYQLAQSVLKRDEHHHWQIIENPNRLRIITIDALSAYIVNRMPILSQVGGDLEVMDFPQPYYQMAVQALLTQTALETPAGEALRTLLVHLDNRIEKIQSLLIQLLWKRDQWLPYLHQIKLQASDIEEYLENCLNELIESHLQLLHATLAKEDVSNLLAVIRFAAESLKAVDPNHSLIQCIDLYDLPACDLDALPQWLAIINFLTTQKNTWRKTFMEKDGLPSPSKSKNKVEKEFRTTQKSTLLTLIAQFNENPNLLSLMGETHYLPDPQLSSAQSEILKALGELLPLLVAHLQVVFQSAGKMDFSEVALRSLDALGDELAPSDIALRLDYQCRHILIDEYQDTSITQYRLFEKLVMGWQSNDGRSLFLVGDPMQSIYRFRGAEVGLFIHTQQYGLGNIALTPLTLSVNFRSTSTIIEWINSSFSQLFPNTIDENLGGVTYSPAIAHRSINEGTHVNIQPGTPERPQTQTIIDIILSHLQNYPNENIAILVRSRKHLAPIIEQLKTLRLGFVALEAEQVADRSHIVDIISLLKATANTQNRIAWLAILRAPWLGLTLADLFYITQHNPTLTLWETLVNYSAINELSEDGKLRLARFVPIMHYWLQNQHRNRLSRWLKSLWLALEGPHCYTQTHLINDIDTVFALIDQFEIGGSLSQMEAFELRLQQLYADITPAFQENCVAPLITLMTIHKAKGLEFDTVIMPQLQASVRADQPELFLWLDRAIGNKRNLLLAPYRSSGEQKNELYHYIARQIKQKGKFESVRLLYVGATRAKKRLHLLGDVNFDENNELKSPPPASFWGLLWPVIQPQLAIQTRYNNSIANPQLNNAKPFMLERLPSHWKSSFSLPIETNINELNIPEYIEPYYREAGIIFHRILQHLTTNPRLDYKQACTIALKRLGYTASQLALLSGWIVDGIENMLSDTRGQWILQPHTERYNEWELSVKTPKGFENIIIDTSFVDNQGIRWIIDYKLIKIENETELLAETQKYRSQLQRYTSVLALTEKRPIKSALYFPLNKIWWECTDE